MIHLRKFENKFDLNRISHKDKFINRSTDLHKGKYKYDKVDYITARKPVTIICPIHGDFNQLPYNHLIGKGCDKCAREENRKGLTKTKEKFIEDAIKVHGSKYKYDNSHYVNDSTKLKISCPKHGEFEQLPNHHLNGRGCPSCIQSYGEREIENYLSKNKIIYERQKKFSKCRNQSILSFDFWIPNKNLLIEFDGIQHFKQIGYFGDEAKFNYRKSCDEIKNKFCQDNNIQLLRIPYTDIKKIDKILDNYLS